MEKIWRLYSNTGDNKSESILDAIMRNDCVYVINYYENGNDISFVDAKKENFLHKAARNDNYEIVDLLIKLGLNVNAHNRYGDTPLHLAVQFNNYEVAEKIIFEGGHVNAQNKKMVAPLHIASANGSDFIVNSLLEHGAKINISDDNGMHPIHYAVKSGQKTVIRTLLNGGASLVECDDRGNNVLHHACESGNDELLVFILRHMMITDTKNIYGQTPLHIASIHCSVKGLYHLIQAGFRIDLKDNNQMTPYDLAVRNFRNENATFLQECYNGNDYREKFLKYDLHTAASQNNYQYLFEKVNSTNVNSLDFFGRSLMYYAIITGNLKIVKLLYRKGANLDKVDEFNQSALLISIYTENLELVRFILKHGGKVNEIFYNRSYLYRAILRNNFELVKLLIDHGADVNYVDNKHRNIYSYAMECSSDDILALLLENKARLV